MRVRIIRRAATTWLFATGVALLPPRAAAVDRLYHFVDEYGVSHFSNVPADARYRPIGPMDGSAPAAAANASLPGAATAVPPPPVPAAAEPEPELNEMPPPDPVDAEDMEPHSDDS